MLKRKAQTVEPKTAKKKKQSSIPKKKGSVKKTGKVPKKREVKEKMTKDITTVAEKEGGKKTPYPKLIDEETNIEVINTQIAVDLGAKM